MNHPTPRWLAALLTLSVSPFALACDRECGMESEPIDDDEPLGEEDDRTALEVVEQLGGRVYEVEIFWDEDAGLRRTASSAGIGVVPPTGQAVLSVRFDGIREDSVFRNEWTGVCAGRSLSFESEVEAIFGDAEPSVDAAGSVRSSPFGDWVDAELEVDALEPELTIHVHGEAEGEAPPRLNVWMRLRDDGQVEQAGLTLTGLSSGSVELAGSDLRSAFRVGRAVSE